MDNDTKTTFAVIVALILILGTLAYFLRGTSSGSEGVNADRKSVV